MPGRSPPQSWDRGVTAQKKAKKQKALIDTSLFLSCHPFLERAEELLARLETFAIPIKWHRRIIVLF